MSRLTSAIGAIALLSLASGASAARWVDKYGRILTLQAPGLTEAMLQPGQRTAAQAATSFKALCLDTNLDRTAAGKAAAAAGFVYRPQMMPFKTPVDVGSWVSADAELSIGRDLFFLKDPQCNLTFALSGPPDRSAAVEALTALIGPPANAAKAVKKDGMPDKRWQPEWRLPTASGATRRVFLHQHQPNAIQLAVVEQQGAK